MADFLDKNSSVFPELARAFAKYTDGFRRLRDQRDNVVHYKAKAVVFDEVPLSFALLNAAGTEARQATPDGGERVVTTPVMDFVNGQMVALYRFMHEDLAEAIVAHARRVGMRYQEIGSDTRMTCIGISLFKRVNEIIA